MRRLGGIPKTRQFRELIREEALPSPRLAKAPILPIAPMAPVSMAKFPTSPVAPIAPNAVAQSAMANLPVEMQTILIILHQYPLLKQKHNYLMQHHLFPK